MRGQSLIIYSILLVFIAVLPKELQSSSTLKVGDKFPGLKVRNLGKGGRKPASKSQFSMAKFKNKVVLVDFWASWCGPCKMALPEYNKLYRKYRKKGFTVVGVNVDEVAKDGLSFIKQHPVSFPLAYDSGRRLVQKVGVSTMPTSYLLGPKGRVKYIHRGFHKGDEAEMEKQVKKLLRKVKKKKS